MNRKDRAKRNGETPLHPVDGTSGITLREHIATQVLAGIYAKVGTATTSQYREKTMVEEAIQAADTLLFALEAPNE